MTSPATLLLLFLAMAGPAQVDDRAQPSFREQFGVIVQRNIFVRNRNDPAPPATASADQPAPPPPPPMETRFVLTGIVEDEAVYRALIEDRQVGELFTVPLEGAVAQGRLVEIDLDGAVYESQDHRVRIEIGRNLLGELPSAAGARTNTSSGGGSPAANVSTTTDTEGLTPEERMRRRRLQETNP